MSGAVEGARAMGKQAQTKLRIGIPIIGGKGWLGGVSYVELLARSNAMRGDKSGLVLSLIVKPDTLESLELHTPFLQAFEHVLFWLPPGISSPPTLQNSGKAVICHTLGDIYRHIDVYFPLPWDAWPGACVASWLPDFQHRFLPDFFSAQERANRDRDIGKVAEQSPFIVLSSQTAEKHFRQFYPATKAITRVLSFYTLVEEKTFAADVKPVLQKYGVPERYVMCSNQFWIHKDHGTLFRAMARCREQGLDLTLVCTGALEDYRHPDYMARLRTLLRELQLTDRVFILGTLPRQDQMQLMRGALATVQPSLFEGWSTVVEDGRALGKIQFLSDLDVHREQAPLDALFFKQGNVEDLCRVLLEVIPRLQPGPNLVREAQARHDSAEQVRVYGEKLEQFMRECVARFRGEALSKPMPPLEEVLREATQSFREGRGEEAEALLTSASHRADATARLFNDLGVIRLSLTRRQEALQAFARALWMDVDYERAFENLWDALAIESGNT
jgi:glycosyltransferase involved in cell wall biosynthesis